MRSEIFLILIITLVATETYSQWQWQNPLPQGNDLHKVWVFDSSTVLVVGFGNGTILHTSNGGESWDVQYLQPGHYFYSIYFINSTTGYSLIGRNNTVRPNFLFKTTDQGKTWIEHSPINFEVHSLFFVNKNLGWATGNFAGRIYKTTDGGMSWLEQSHDTLKSTIGLYFVDSLTGWAVGIHGFIVKTTDGGATWIRQYLDRSDVAQLLSVHFVDSNNGWSVGSTIGEGYIACTTNGGDTWQTKLLTNEAVIFYDVYFTSPESGCAVSFNGKIYHTTDGGINWSYFQTKTTDALTSIHFDNNDRQHGWSVGLKGFLFSTRDGGNNWQTISRGTRSTLRSITFLDTLTGWAVGHDGVILNTSDGGLNWRTQFRDSLLYLTSVQFYNNMIGWAIGSKEMIKGILLKTTNGGITWTTQNIYNMEFIRSIDFIDSANVWIIGSREYYRFLMKSTNSGNDWFYQPIDTAGSFYSVVDMIDNENGWLIGANNYRLMKTSDGGLTWEQKFNRIEQPIANLFFFNDQVGFAVGGTEVVDNEPMGGEGYIYFTNDGGESWTLQDSSAPDMYKSVDFVDNLHGWAVGYRGTIYHTSDGGLNWSRQQIPYSKSLYSVDFVNSKVGWICGDNGAIFKTKTGGVSTGVSNDGKQISLPKEWCLYQNYPNPFNAQTTIEFDVPQEGRAVIEVYNIIGQKITTLFDHNVEIGKYKINFDASRYSSGIYFYRLRSEKQIITKKLLLLR